MSISYDFHRFFQWNNPSHDNRFSKNEKYVFLSPQNRGEGLDMNVQGAWAEGITGTGIVVTILDDGLEKDHPDLYRNYVSLFLDNVFC